MSISVYIILCTEKEKKSFPSFSSTVFPGAAMLFHFHKQNCCQHQFALHKTRTSFFQDVVISLPLSRYIRNSLINK